LSYLLLRVFCCSFSFYILAFSMHIHDMILCGMI
jgi:hypothetical protein